jgi:tetratricopeptide (TPR) repeat protein
MTIQNEIIDQLVNILQEQINYDLLSYSYAKKDVQLAVYENWLIGMDLVKQKGPENEEKAREYFKAALDINPKFAPAHTGISLSYYNEWSCQLWEKWDENMSGAHKYALEALKHDENDYVSLAILGATYIFIDEYDKAEHYLRKSIRMNPSDAKNLARVAFYLPYLGFSEEALTLIEKAKKLDPFRMESYYPANSFIHFELGNYEKSVELGGMVDLSKVWTDFSAYISAAYFHAYWQKYTKIFDKRIGSLPSTTNTMTALQWHMDINPYKGKTNLEPFWKYLLKENPELTIALTTQSPNGESKFSKEGEVWHLSFAGKSTVIKDIKGLHDLARLLADPNKEYHCTELMGASISNEKGIAALDDQSKKEYEDRIRHIQSEIAEAEAMNDLSQIERLQEEYDKILQHLTDSLGLAGKPREIGSSVEKCRSAVTWRIRQAIKKVENLHPDLGNHLTHSIKTGTFCSYRPETLIQWAF